MPTGTNLNFMKSKLFSYKGKTSTVTFNAARCIHAGECVRGLPGVFDPDKKPWIDPDNASAEDLEDVIKRCPTGALTLTEEEAVPGENTVRVMPGGPLYVRGAISLDLGDGNVVHETRLALCRCGASSNKPLCDGRHKKAGFSDSGRIRESKMKDGEAETKDLSVKLAANGPLLCEGPMVLSAGKDTIPGIRTALCRCGASRNKPFCDGMHREIDFQGQE